MTQRPRPSSLDGFIPGNQGRHVGFSSAKSGPSSAHQRVRIRQLGLHGQSTRNRPVAEVSRPASNSATQRRQSRSTFPDFTSYGNSDQSQPSSASGPSRQSANRSSNQPRQPLGGKRQQRRGFRTIAWKKLFKRTAIVTALFVLLAGGWLGLKIINNSGKVFGGDSNVLGFLNATKLKGEDKGQVNILLAGVSTDDAGHNGANLTDSIMLISVDTTHKKAFMLSIPRDLWVNIPGYGYSKINAANAYGDGDNYSQPGYPAGGMGLLSQVVSERLELPIHYYAKINYTAFRDAVNAVGGIDVNIQSSDKRGLYDPNISVADQGPLKLANGVQKLDGQTALNLARARGDPPGDGRYPYGFEKSDFSRTEHQRLMLLSLKEKITSGGVITNPLKIGQLFDVVGKNMKTDLQPSEIRRMYDIMKQTKTADIQSLSLNDANGVNLLASYRSPDGASALIPAAGVDDFSVIKMFLKKATTADPVVREAAEIVILNGGDITGLASKFSNTLTSKGLNIAAVGDAPRQAGANTIVDQSGGTKPGTKVKLQQLFGGTATATVPPGAAGYPDADFVIILGTNQAAPQSSE